MLTPLISLLSRFPRPGRGGALLLAAVAVAVSLAAACGGPPAPPKTTEAAMCPHPVPPARVGIIQDLTARAAPGIRLTPVDLDQTIAALGCGGGELAVAVLDGRDEPLLRLRLTPAPPPPATPVPDKNSVRGREARDQYDADVTRWQEATKSWKAATATEVKAFKDALAARLTREPQEDADVWKTVRRMGDFFNEQPAGGGTPTSVFVFISERERVVRKCLDITGKRVIEPRSSFTDNQTGITWVCDVDGEWKNTATMAAMRAGTLVPPESVLPVDPRWLTIAVKGASGPGPLDPVNPKKFEQPGAALRFVAETLGARPPVGNGTLKR